jgi:hypothetical protein
MLKGSQPRATASGVGTGIAEKGADILAKLIGLCLGSEPPIQEASSSYLGTDLFSRLSRLAQSQRRGDGAPGGVTIDGTPKIKL